MVEKARHEPSAVEDGCCGIELREVCIDELLLDLIGWQVKCTCVELILSCIGNAVRTFGLQIIHVCCVKGIHLLFQSNG